jgi:hypothetical protein
MATEKQLTANRANAKKSTGPRTEHGKRISARNGSRQRLFASHVLLVNESRDAFHALWNSFKELIEPEDAIENALMETMVMARWRNERLWAIEAANINKSINDVALSEYNGGSATLIALAMRQFPDGGSTQDKISHYEYRCDRQFHRAAERLARYREEKRRQKNLNQGEPN